MSRSRSLRKDLKDQVRVELNKEDEAHKKSNTDYAELVDTIVSFINHFWCPMGVTIWTIGNGGQYASDGRTIKIFAQNLVDHGSTKIPYFDDFPF